MNDGTPPDRVGGPDPGLDQRIPARRTGSAARAGRLANGGGPTGAHGRRARPSARGPAGDQEARGGWKMDVAWRTGAPAESVSNPVAESGSGPLPGSATRSFGSGTTEAGAGGTRT